MNNNSINEVIGFNEERSDNYGSNCNGGKRSCYSRVIVIIVTILTVIVLVSLHPPQLQQSPVLLSILSTLNIFAVNTASATTSRSLSHPTPQGSRHHANIHEKHTPISATLKPEHPVAIDPSDKENITASTKPSSNRTIPVKVSIPTQHNPELVKKGTMLSHPKPAPLVAPSFTNTTRMLSYNDTDIEKYSLSNDHQLRAHIHEAGFGIFPKSPHHAFTSFKIHSARSGSADRLDGIGSKCDWSITWNGVLYGVTATPRIVCVGTRQIERFWELVPFLTRSRFLLVTGGGDRLQPLRNSEYSEYKGFGGDDGGPGWKMFTESPNILHVFSENHNMNHSRYSTLPCGFPHTRVTTPTDLLRSIERHIKPHIPFDERPVRLLVSDRVRDGPWYRDRVMAREYCVNVSSSFCSTGLELDLPDNTSIHENSPGHAKFVWSVQNSQFVMCTHGGGLDPSPKAWETVFIGSIPIIQHSTLDDGYIRLPLVIVPNITEFLFNADGKSPDLLDQWLEEMRPYYEEGSALRRQALHRLTHDYWYDVLKDKYDEIGASINEAVSRGEIPKY